MSLRDHIKWEKGPMYIPCDNPLVKELMNYSHERRYYWMSEFKPSSRDGKRYCAWCNQKETKSGRHKYCSDECQLSCDLFCTPCGYNGFGYLFNLQKGHCRICNHDWVQYYDTDFYIKRYIDGKGWFNPFHIKHMVPYEFLPEMDHIEPVAMGGPVLGHDNIQLICKSCHKIKTKTDIVKIRANPCQEQAKRKKLKKKQASEEERLWPIYDEKFKGLSYKDKPSWREWFKENAKL